MSSDSRRAMAEQTWSSIEAYIQNECALIFDMSKGDRETCINTILNATPEPAFVAAAVEFLRSGPGLHKVRVGRVMMTREDVAHLLSASLG